MMEIRLPCPQYHCLGQSLLHPQAAQQRPQHCAVLIHQFLHAEPVLGIVARTGAFKPIGRVAQQMSAVVIAHAPQLDITPGAAQLLVELLHHAMVSGGKAPLAVHRLVKLLRLQQAQVRPHLSVQPRQCPGWQMVFI